MQNYSTLQLQSMAILIIFLVYFIVKIGGLFRNIKNKSLLKRYRTLKKLKKLSWDDFERLCMELFSKQGWNVLGNEKKGADGGVDIWMKKNTFLKQKHSAIVQCKRYDDAMVTIKVVREMYGLMHEYDVSEAYIVTTSRFTKECYKFVVAKQMHLIDGETLIKMIHQSSS